MATNSSNITAAGEVGWQAAPLTRGTASILWNCTSVILLITWTSFHSSMGISRTQRMITTITATLVPELSALVAMRDMLFAHRLHCCLKYYVERPGWEGWTMTKSFLVVKGGVRAGPHYSRLCSNSDFTYFVNIASDQILDPETFLLLALMDSIRYEDFPSTAEINDTSKADWFSTVATLVQLFWAIVNMACRLHVNCTISVMELIILDWVVFGLIAIMLWWKCPQNIKIPYTIPIQDSSILTESPSSDHDLHLSMEELHEYVTDYDYLMEHWNSTPHFPLGHWSACIIPFVIIKFVSHYIFWSLYQWHLAPHRTAWIVLTVFSTLSEFLIFLADPHLRFEWSETSIFQNYIHPLLLDPPLFKEEQNTLGGKWLALARWMGIYNPTDLPWRCASQETWHDNDLKLVVGAVIVTLACQSGMLAIALMAFTNAPSGIYDVPKMWILEALVHVGG